MKTIRCTLNPSGRAVHWIRFRGNGQPGTKACTWATPDSGDRVKRFPAEGVEPMCEECNRRLQAALAFDREAEEMRMDLYEDD